MKPNRSNPLAGNFFRGNSLVAAVVISLVGLAMQPAAQAGNLYWDANGAASGSGNLGGTWDAGTFWSTDSFGFSATSGWVDGENAVFSADTDGIGAWTVTVSGTVTTPSILVEEAGAKTIAGGAINIGGGIINTALAGSGDLFTISSAIAGSGGLTLAANGDLSDGATSGGATLLSGTNTISGNITITSGLVRANSSFGDVGNKLVFNGGGIVDPNLSLTLTRNIEVGAAGGTIRLYGSSTTNLNGNISNFSGVATANLKHTDGGTLRLGGSGAGFTGTFNNARGNLEITAANANWANTAFVLNGSGGSLTFNGTGTATAKSITTTTKDTNLNNGTVLNVPAYTWSTSSGAAWIKSTAGAEGKLTSSTGTITLTNGSLVSGNLETDDNQINVVIENSGATPVAVVKNNNNGLILNRVNTFTGGLTINAGRVQAGNAAAYGTGTVNVSNGGQALLGVAGIFPNNFIINGLGTTETAGTLGAIRFSSNTVSGNIQVASASRITAHGGFGTHTGALTGSADLEINSTASGNNGIINLSGNTAGYTGTMTVSQGTLNVGALGGGLTAAGGTANLSGALAGPATVNSGTLNLNSGATITTPTINGGTLSVNTGSTVSGSISTTAAATINTGGTITGSTTLDSGDTLGLRGGTIGAGLSMLASTTVNYSSTLAVTGNINFQGTQTVNLVTTPSPGSTVTLLTYSGTATDSGDSNLLNNFVLGNPSAYRSVAFANPAGSITLTIGGESHNWVGNNGTNPTFWDTVTTNWTSSDQKFFNGDAVTFDDSATGITVAMQSLLSPSSIVFNNTAKNFTVTGAAGTGITGTTGITKNGTGSLTLGGAGSTFTGPVVVNGGLLNLNNGEALGFNSSITIASGARLNFNGHAPANQGRNYSWTIAGDGGDGAAGLGALYTTGGDINQNAGILNLTLSGNAEIGGNNGRIDAGRSGVNFGNVTGGGFTLTKVGTNSVVVRAPATNITYVVNSGMLSFEDYNTASGTNPITVNGTASMGSYGLRVLPNDVTLNTGTTLISRGGDTGTWTGVITAAGNVNFQTDSNLVIDGSLVGTGNITRNGGNTLVLQNSAASYSGKIINTGGTLRIESAAAIGTATGADVITMAGGTLQGGTIAGQASLTIGSATQGITLNAGTGNVTFDAGTGNTLTIDGAVIGTGNIVKANNTGTLLVQKDVNIAGASKINANGGSQTFNGNVTVGTGGFEVGTNIVSNLNSPAFTSAGPMVFYTGSTNIAIGTGSATVLNMGNASAQHHTINHTAGSLAVSSQILAGHWGGGTSTYNISGGSLNQPDTVTTPTNEGQANLFLGIDGSGILNISGSGTVNTTSLVVNGRSEGHNGTQADTLNLTGGRLNLGKWGMRTQGTTYAVNLGGGILGASADWSSSLNMALTGTGGNVSVNTLDSVNATTPRTITLSGVLSGTGGLTKTGAGAVVLSGANSYTGATEVNGGKLHLGTTSASTVSVNAGATLQAGSPAASATATVNGLTLNGGTASFRANFTTGDKLVISGTDTFTVPVTTTLSVQPAGDLVVNDEIPIIDYTGLELSSTQFNRLALAPIANPHFAGSLVHDTTNTIVVLKITAADTISWKGNVNGNWDVNTTSNWVLGSNDTISSKYYDFDTVTLGDAGIGTPTLTLVGAITPGGSVKVENTTGTYTLQGSGISGGAGLSKTGAGGLTLLNDNSYVGTTSIGGGTVTVGNGGTVGALGGSGAINLSAGATLVMDRSDAQTVARSITGGGTLVSDGGNFTLNAASNSCDIIVNSGTFFARGGGFSAAFNAGKLITINAGATLDTVGHSMGSSVGGGGDVPKVTLNGGAWKLNNEQYIREFTMTAGTTIAPGEIRTLGGSVYTINAAAASSTIGSNLNMVDGASLVVNDGAAVNDLSISGNIIGGGVLTKSGAGTVVLSGTNSRTGGTAVNGGLLEASAVADAGGLGSIGVYTTGGTGYLAIANDSTFRYTGTGAETTTRYLWIDTGAQTKTIEVVSATGSITFSGTGGNINKPMRKTGAGALIINDVMQAGTTVTVDGGKLTLGGTNTYTGATVVNATGTLAVDGDSIDNTGRLDINGSGKVEVTNSEVVGTLYIDGAQMASGTYGATGSGATTIDNTHFSGTGVVSVTTGPVTGYGTWASANAPTGTPSDDYDGDGVSNAMEWVLGGLATTKDLDKLPKLSVSGANVIFTFVRNDAAWADGGTTVDIELGTTLAAWPSSHFVPAVPGVYGPVTVTDNGGTDTVTLTVPMAPDAKKFARLRVSVAP